MTQEMRVLAYMEKFGGITQREATNALGVARLASRICDLKKAGHKIEVSMIQGTNRFGEKTRFAQYKIAATQ